MRPPALGEFNLDPVFFQGSKGKLHMLQVSLKQGLVRLAIFALCANMNVVDVSGSRALAYVIADIGGTVHQRLHDPRCLLGTKQDNFRSQQSATRNTGK